MRAYNGTSWSNWTGLTVTGTNSASVADASNDQLSYSLVDFTFAGDDASSFPVSPGQTTLTQSETLPLQSSQAQGFSEDWLEPSQTAVEDWMSLTDIAQAPPGGMSEPEGLTNFSFVGDGGGTTPSNPIGVAAMQLSQSSFAGGMGTPWTARDESQAAPSSGTFGSSIAQNVGLNQLHHS